MTPTRQRMDWRCRGAAEASMIQGANDISTRKNGAWYLIRIALRIISEIKTADRRNSIINQYTNRHEYGEIPSKWRWNRSDQTKCLFPHCLRLCEMVGSPSIVKVASVEHTILQKLLQLWTIRSLRFKKEVAVNLDCCSVFSCCVWKLGLSQTED